MQKLKTSHLPAEISNCLQSKSYCKLVAEDSWSGLVQLNKGKQAEHFQFEAVRFAGRFVAMSLFIYPLFGPALQKKV